MTTEFRNARRAWLGVSIVLAATLLPGASTWARDFPQEAIRGTMTGFNYPEVAIGKRVYRMAPASRIRNEQNLIIMPSATPAKAEVMYRLDFNGIDIRDMWILTPSEVKALGPAPKQ